MSEIVSIGKKLQTEGRPSRRMERERLKKRSAACGQQLASAPDRFALHFIASQELEAVAKAVTITHQRAEPYRKRAGRQG